MGSWVRELFVLFLQLFCKSKVIPKAIYKIMLQHNMSIYTGYSLIKKTMHKHTNKKENELEGNISSNINYGYL